MLIAANHHLQSPKQNQFEFMLPKTKNRLSVNSIHQNVILKNCQLVKTAIRMDITLRIIEEITLISCLSYFHQDKNINKTSDLVQYVYTPTTPTNRWKYIG